MKKLVTLLLMGYDAFSGGANNWTDWDQMPSEWK